MLESVNIAPPCVALLLKINEFLIVVFPKSAIAPPLCAKLSYKVDEFIIRLPRLRIAPPTPKFEQSKLKSCPLTFSNVGLELSL